MSMPEKIKRTIKKYGDYVDLFKNCTKEEIAKIINKYGDYMGVLKNGTQEEQDKVSHCINDLITAKQEYVFDKHNKERV